MRLTGFGFYFGACILIGTGAGVWLDGRLHTKPWLLLAGLLAGSILGFYGMYVMLKPYLERNHPGAKKRG